MVLDILNLSPWKMNTIRRGVVEETPSDCDSPQSGNNWWKRRCKLRRITNTDYQNHYYYDDEYRLSRLKKSKLPSSAKLNLCNFNKLSQQYVDFRSVTLCDSQLQEDYELTMRNNEILLDSSSSAVANNIVNNKSRNKSSVKRHILGNLSFVTLMNFLVILTFMALLCPAVVVQAFPTATDCDWIGSGTPENVVQAVYLGCQQGQIQWEQPRGGLRVNISPPRYTFKSSSQSPFRLCLESHEDSNNFQVFLEESGSNALDRKLLLPFVSPKSSSTCYRISSSTATLYVESQNQQDSPLVAPRVKISYEIEELKKSEEQFYDDECRPCSDEEVLQLYCVADVVAKGEILSVHGSSQRKGIDTLHIKSNLVIHQNHAVFQPIKPGSKNLLKFLDEDIRTFDTNSPKKVPKSKSTIFGGIVSHPAKCSAQSGPGEFLWLIKLSFGRPKIGCVVYWDRWEQLAKHALQSGTANCPIVYQ